MKILSAAFVCVLSIAVYGVRSQADVPCTKHVNRTVGFSVRSYRDKAGRWVAQVDVEHDDGDHEASPWKVDVVHNTVAYPGAPKVTMTAKLTPPPMKPCPGYQLRQGFGYYKFHTDKKTWVEAKAVCDSEGAHLAIVNGEGEAQVLKELFTQVPDNITGHWALVGFHDMYTEGQFLTVFDEPLNTTGFLRWASERQPDNSGASDSNPGEDCGSIYRNNGYLNDIGCSTPTPFICEVAL